MSNPSSFQYIKNPLSLDGIDLVCCLHAGRCAPEHGRWFATAEGGAAFLDVMPGTSAWRLATAKLGNNALLKDAEAVADYVTSECSSIRCADSSIFSVEGEICQQLEAVSSLAIYPGFFWPSNNRTAVLDGYVNGRLEANDISPIRTLAHFAYPIRYWYSDLEMSAYIFKHLPDIYIGAIALHGTINPNVWTSRHPAAIIEAWRRQLQHPDEQATPRSHFSAGYLLLDHLRHDDRMLVLFNTGLCERDVSDANGFANAFAADGSHEHTKLLLGQLIQKSNIIISPIAEPGDLSQIEFD